jgi:hypothetical protein
MKILDHDQHDDCFYKITSSIDEKRMMNKINKYLI